MKPKSPKYKVAVEMYQAGLSLEEVATYFQITRQAMWDILLRRRVIMRPQKRTGKENHFFRGTQANRRAQHIVEKAVKKGLLIRPTQCATCGGIGNGVGIQAHHCDYNKPLQVMWLCQPCHHLWHKHNRPIPILR